MTENSARTRLILVRHGETDWNAQQRYQGQTDIALNAVGLEQARRLAERLAREPIDVVVASDLGRVRETLAPLVRARGLPVHEDPTLRERHFGVFQGRTRAELLEVDAPRARRLIERDLHEDLGGGESLAAFHARCTQSLEGIVRRWRGSTVLVGTHGGVLDCMYRHAAGLDLVGQRRLRLLNAALNHLTHDGARWEVGRWDDDDHLQASRAEL